MSTLSVERHWHVHSVIAVLVIVECEVCGDLASSYLHRSVLAMLTRNVIPLSPHLHLSCQAHHLIRLS